MERLLSRKKLPSNYGARVKSGILWIIMNLIKTDIRFLVSFFTEKKQRLIHGLILFVLVLYVSIGLLTITTTKTLSYVLDFGGWLNYIIKLPLQLEFRMSTLGIVFFVGTLAVISTYFVVVLSQFGKSIRSHTKAGAFVGLFTVLGIGCASCGTVVLTSILGVIGAAGLIAFLPLHGGEFQIIAFVVAIVSLHVLIQKSIKKTCDI